MKKIGVCACYNSKNYGSMLQTLATEKQLEKLGFSYEIIRYSRKLTPALLLANVFVVNGLGASLIHQK